MRIGMTFDLRSAYLAEGFGSEETAEFDRDDTIDSIEQALRALGHEPVRIGHARQLVTALARGERWDLVFNIAEGMYGTAREAQVPALLDVFNLPYTFSDPLVTALCLHKGLTKTVLREHGIPTPRSATVERLADLHGLDLRFPLFAKPVAEGTGKGVTAASRIADGDELVAACERLLAQFRQPVLVEEFLPGREFTVGLTGTDDEATVAGTLEILLNPQAEPGVYSYANKEQSEVLVRMPLVRAESDPVVAEAEAVSLRAWRALGCRDAGRVDLRCDAAGRPQFMEVNPLAGLHPSHSDLPMLFTELGRPYVELVERIVNSAARRVRSGTRA